MTDFFSLLILQIIIIPIVCRLFNFLFKKIRQPQVVGEMCAGIFLAPEISKIIFPAESLIFLYALGQIGIMVVMNFVTT